MSVFGSREEDPLLREDLFAPNSAAHNPSETGEHSETDRNDGATHRREGEHSGDTRQIVCARQDAADGRIDHLNRALNSNWELTRIQVVDDDQIVFTLRRTRSAGSGTESIV